MPDEPVRVKAHPVLRVLAGFMCPVFLVLGVLFLPVAGLAEHPWQLAYPLGAAVGAVYCGNFAALGRAPRWP